MITEATLKQSLFDPSLFSEHHNEITIVESQNKAKEGTLLKATLRLPNAVFTNISTRFLKDTRNVFSKCNSDGLSMKMMCDGMFLLNKNGKAYLVVCELKSKYEEIAIQQIMASYVKCKAMLLTLASYQPEEYQEIGLIVSFPINNQDKYHVSGTLVQNWKRDQILFSKADLLAHISMQLQTAGKAIVKTSHVGIDNIDLAPCLKGALTLYHVEADDKPKEAEAQWPKETQGHLPKETQIDLQALLSRLPDADDA